MKQAHSDCSDDTDDDSAFAELEGREAEDATEDEIDDDDEVDPVVEISDSAVIDQFAAEINADESLLTPNSKLPAFHYLKYIISTIYLQQLLTIFQI
jgi:hypothetical protein